jgi:5-methylcytosine-specific restriction endonuclease McrA
LESWSEKRSKTSGRIWQKVRTKAIRGNDSDYFILHLLEWWQFVGA